MNKITYIHFLFALYSYSTNKAGSWNPRNNDMQTDNICSDNRQITVTKSKKNTSIGIQYSCRLLQQINCYHIDGNVFILNFYQDLECCI